MAEPKRGSVEAFKAAEEKRKARIASKGKFKIFGKAGSFDSPKKAEAKRKFNEKVAAANKKRINQESVKKFKAAEDRRQVRLAKVNAVKPDSPKGKRIAAKKRAEADVEKDLPKSKINTTAATTVGTAVGTAASQAKKVLTKTKELPKAKPDLKGAASSFGEAFKKARAQGVGTKFAYNDKMYSAVTKDDISRAGKSSLQDFLNSAKRKETKIAKAPGQIIKKQSGGMIARAPARAPEGRMPQISKEKRDRIRKMIASARGAAESFGSPGMRGQRIRDRFNEKASTAKGVESEDFRNLQEAKSFMDQIRKSPAQDRMKTGGSVMARGCKLGRKKPTKMY